MIIVSDTTPLISLMKIDRLDLLQQLFGEVQIPSTVFEELVSNSRFPNESRQIRECIFIKKENILSKEEVLKCIETLKITGRHISDKLYEQLIKKLSD